MKSTTVRFKGPVAIQLLALALAFSAGRLSAQTLFSENFDDLNAGSRWGVNPSAAGTHPVDLAFDYNTVGIPSAPNSVGGTTIGVKLQANTDTGNPGLGGVSISPTGGSFTGDYILRFDMWLNYNGPVDGGGSGSTQVTGAGVMTSGTVAQWAGSTQTSVHFGVTGDGGSSVDYRAYSSAAGTGYPDASPVFAASGAGNRNNNHAYYSGFGGAAAPPAQVALYPQQTGTTITGSQGFKWRDVEIKKEGNIITYKIDTLLIATVDASALSLGGNNILLNHYDINATVSGDPNAPALLFGLIDNVRVEAFSTVVNVTASTPTANEQGPVNGVFTLTRTGDNSAALTVNYTVSGTATSGADYNALPGSVTFVAGAASTNVTVVPIDDGTAEFTETVILSVSASTNYVVGTGSATVNILDNEGPELSISVTQSNLLESFSGANATFRIDRKGLLATNLTANLSYAGTATLNTDYSGPASVAIPANAASTNFNITPINDLVYEGTETVIASVAAGTGYVIGSPASATAVVIDDDLPTTTTLFSDKFDTDTSANWFVNKPGDGSDAFADFSFDYSTAGIPEAPSSAGTFTATRGLKFRVNESLGVINGLSASPTNGNFTGDYRLRFDMWLNYSGPLSSTSVTGTTQNASAGVGTTGVEPVWPGGGQAEGVWFSVASDGQNNATVGDYNAWVGTTLQADGSGVYAAGTVAGVRDHNAAYYNLWGSVAAPAAQLALYPMQTGVTYANSIGMSWHTVTITRQGTNVTWDIDGRRIATVDISAVNLSTNVSVGFHDPYASVTTNAPMQFGLVDNVRVENLVVLPTITSIQIISSGTQVQIDFTAAASDEPSSFALQASGVVNTGYADVSATITEPTPGNFRAVGAVGGSQQYYRIRRL